MKLWLDDCRPMPPQFDTWVKTAPEAIQALKAGGVTHISLDHDLGDGAGNGYDVAVFIEEGAATSTLAPLIWSVHSQNNVGKAKITMALERADAFWSKEDNRMARHKNKWFIKADANKRVIIMRGLPGSGKSTKARTYGGTIVSADDYFIQDGEYKFDSSKLGAAHGRCRRLFEEALQRGDPIVVVDNTNTTEREYRDYIDMANQYGYSVEYDVVGNGGVSIEELVKRNTHGVPEQSIRRMVDRWHGDPLYPEAKKNSWTK